MSPPCPRPVCLSGVLPHSCMVRNLTGFSWGVGLGHPWMACGQFLMHSEFKPLAPCHESG